TLGILALALMAGPSRGADRLSVVATTVQITALAKEVSGGLVNLTGLVPAGADPHEFEPRASDLVAVEGADLVLRHGVRLDDWLNKTLKAAKRAKLVTVTAGVRLRKETEEGKVVEDPHVWHDPVNAKKMIDNIAAALDRADPAHKAAYDANAAAYKKKLDGTATQVRAILAEIPPASRNLVTNHDAFAYFAKAYDLKTVAALIP